MLNIFLIFLSAIFLLFSMIDLLLHQKKKIKRSKPGYVFLCVLVFSCLATGYFGISNAMTARSNIASQKYLAVKYLAVGNAEQAIKYINILPDASDNDKYYKTILSMVADGLKGHYSSVVEKAQLLIGTTNLTFSQMSQVLQLSDISQKIEDTQRDSPEYAALRSQASEAFENATDKLFKDFRISDDIRMTYDAVFAIDAAVANRQFTAENEQIAINLIDKDNENAYKAAVKYFFAKGDLITAQETAKALVVKHPTVNNKIIYTDILAQRVRNSLTLQSFERVAGDPEVAKIITHAEKLETEASSYENLIYNEPNQEKRDRYAAEKERLLSKAADLNKQAALVPVLRAINYLIDSKPLLGDRTGLLDMQIAKLYFAADEIEKSREYVHKVLDSSSYISPDSIIKNDIAAIEDALADSYNSGIPPESLFAPAVDNIVNKMSQNIVPAEQLTVNEEFKNSVVSELKYSNLQLFISKVDYTKYPRITAYVNLSGQKSGLFGLANDYTDKDFVLTDTDYRISNFKLTKNSADDGASIAIVLDHSGSMQGRPFEDARLAVLSCIDNKGGKDRFSVVTYSDGATIVSGLNSDAALLRNAVNLINYPNGGTNIVDGLFKGLETLSAASGVKAMILFTDGQDNSSEEGSLEKVLQYAKTNGIVIFTVGLGDVDEHYLRYVAEQTGAAFLRADNTAQLYDIYRLLQKYIVNNYIFEYSIEKNPDIQVRKCDVLFEAEGISDVKFYHLGGGNVPADEETYDAFYRDPNSLWLERVNPSSVAITKVGNNVKVKITGRNFNKQMKVMFGNFYSKSVNVISSTEAEVLLPEALTPGFYAVTVENPDGNRKTNEMAFSLFRPGAAKKIKVGQLTIEANTIGKIDDFTYVASGNVIINGILRANVDVRIYANAPKKLDFSGDEVIDLAQTGSVEGNGKVYISYSAMKENSELFANLILGGKDFIVKNGKFSLQTSPASSDFELAESSWNIKIPTIINLELNKVAVVSDGVEFTAFKGDIVEIKDALKGAFSFRQGASDSSVQSSAEFLAKVSDSGGSTQTMLALPAPRTPLEKLKTEFKFKATVSDILFKTSVEFEGNYPIGNIDIGSFKIDIDTISTAKKYYTLGFGINTGRIIPGLSQIPKIGGSPVNRIYAELSSYYVYPDSILLGMRFESGKSLIKIYKVIEITDINGGVEKLAFVTKPVMDSFLPVSFVNKIENDPQFERPSAANITFFIGAEADLQLLNLLPVDINIAKLRELLEIAEIKDAKISLAPFKLDAQMSAKMKLLQQEVAGVDFSLNPAGAKAELQLKCEAKLLGNGIKASAHTLVLLKNEPALFLLELNGHLNCSFPVAKVYYDGNGTLRISVENNITALEMYDTNSRLLKLGYDANGNVKFLNRFIVEF